MPKITLIGAGSVVFTRNLCSDILLDAGAARQHHLPDGHRRCEARTSRELVQAIVDGRGLDAGEATTDRREAVRDADYVVTTFQQGGLDAYAMDIEIPRATASSSAWATRLGRAAYSGP